MEVGWRAGRRMDLDDKGRYKQLRCRGQSVRQREIKDGR